MCGNFTKILFKILFTRKKNYWTYFTVRVTFDQTTFTLMAKHMKCKCVGLNTHDIITFKYITWLNVSALSFHIQEVVVDFEAHAISDSDFNGIKKLLQQVCTFLF